MRRNAGGGKSFGYMAQMDPARMSFATVRMGTAATAALRVAFRLYGVVGS
jgi:hypothetical protein